MICNKITQAAVGEEFATAVQGIFTTLWQEQTNSVA
jgi:hypothetical protein